MTAVAAAPARTRRAGHGPLFWPYLIAALPGALVVLFILYPTVTAFVQAFQKVDATGGTHGFAGLANFRALFAGGLFGRIVVNSLVYGLSSLILCVALALGIALLITGAGQRTRSPSRLMMVSLFSPTILPMIAAANLWAFFLAPRFGIVSKLLAVFGATNANLLSQPHSAMAVLVLLFLWKYVPYFTLFLMAGLQAVPADVYEALRTESPRRFYGFRRVVLPLLAPMLLFVSTLALLYSFEVIDSIFVLTAGGPNNATNVLIYYLYQLAFQYFQWGQASALSAIVVVVFATIAGVSLISIERRTFHWQ